MNMHKEGRGIVPSGVGKHNMDAHEAIWAYVKVTPLPASGGCYRSRIYTTHVGINPLVAACEPLLNLVLESQYLSYPADSHKFLKNLAHEIRDFEHSAQIAKYAPWDIVIARYVLCGLVDEVIADSVWGKQHDWLDNSLGALFYSLEFTVDSFLPVVEQILLDLPQKVHLLELIYLCLVLGFTGKYRGATQGGNDLGILRERLYQIIMQYTAPQNKELLVGVSKEQEGEPMLGKGARVFNVAPSKLWGCIIGILGIMGVMMYVGLSCKLKILSKPLYVKVEQLVGDKSGSRV